MSKLVVITDSELADGFRLAGVGVFEANTAEEARECLFTVIEEERAGIVAVKDAYLAALDERTRTQLEQGYRPVILGIPVGVATTPEERRSHYIAELIRRAIGFHITFREEESE